MTKEEAITKAETKWWLGKSAREIVDFQLYEDRLCMDFSDFHKALETALGRPVWTHEFADRQGLQAEYEGKRPAESNPLESAARIFHKLGRDDLIENAIVLVSPNLEVSDGE